MKRILMFSGE